MFDLFRADRALCQRLGIVEPRLFQAELPRGAALEVGDEHGVFSALPFEISGGDEAALKFLQRAPGIGKFPFRVRSPRSDEDAVKSSPPRITVGLARDTVAAF